MDQFLKKMHRETEVYIKFLKNLKKDYIFIKTLKINNEVI